MDEMTTGAGNDLDRVTDITRRMVTEWGMSKEIGPLTFGSKGDEVFLGRDFAKHKEYSDETALLIDGAIRKIVDAAYAQAQVILREHTDALHAVAKALLIRKTLSGDDVEVLAKGGSLPEVKLTTDDYPDDGGTPAVTAPEPEEPAGESSHMPSLDDGQPAEG